LSDPSRIVSCLPLGTFFPDLLYSPPFTEEQQVAQFILDAAAAQQLTTRATMRETSSCIFPLLRGRKSPCVILQSHLDMVCEKRHDVVHDFDKDPIRMVRDGDCVMADGRPSEPITASVSLR